MSRPVGLSEAQEAVDALLCESERDRRQACRAVGRLDVRLDGWCRWQPTPCNEWSCISCQERIAWLRGRAAAERVEHAWEQFLTYGPDMTTWSF